MTDAEFVRAFEIRQLKDAHFGHRDHLRMAWWYLQDRSLKDAVARTQEAIRSFARDHAHIYRYHATLTELWVRLIAAHRDGHPFSTFGDFIDANGELLDKKLPLRFYSAGLLYSDDARSRWVAPDVRSLPDLCRTDAR